MHIPNKGNKHKENQYLVVLGIVLFLFRKFNPFPFSHFPSPIKGLHIPNKGNKHKENQYLATLGIVLFLFCKRDAESKTLHHFHKIKKPITFVIGFLCGERGIRTPGPVTVNSFQDCRNRPLCHFSSSLLYFCIASANIARFFNYAKKKIHFLNKKSHYTSNYLLYR